MQNDNKRIEMLSRGSIGKTLFILSAPAIAGMLVMALYNLADTFFVGLLRDTTAIAATGIVFPLFQLVGAVGLTFGMGAASVISRRLGADDPDGAKQTAATAMYSAVFFGIVLAISGILFIRPILILFGATDSILNQAELYGRIIIGGSFFQVINMTTNNLLRSEAASIHSSMGQISGAVLNIILDPIFIFVLDLGITGAAIATVISQAFSTAFLLSFYVRKKGVLEPLDIRHVSVKKKTYEDIMTLGFPTFTRQIMGSVSFALLNNAAGVHGDSAIAAVSIINRIFMLLLMSLMGVAQGLQPLAGYNYGAKNYKRVFSTINLVFRISFFVGLCAGLLAFVFSADIIRIFTPDDTEVIRLGSMAIRLMSLFLVPTCLVLMFGGVFQALGDGRSALLLAAGQQGLFMIPLLVILPIVMGLPGVFMAQPLGFFFAFVIGAIMMKKTLKGIHIAEKANLSR